jgi:hypothetical protein
LGISPLSRSLAPVALSRSLSISGELELIHSGHKLLDLKVGDMLGEMELCNPQGGSSVRQHTLVGSGKVVIARIAFENFVTFVEGMGPKQAKRLRYVLSSVILQ